MDKESTRKIVPDEKNLYGAVDKSSEQLPLLCENLELTAGSQMNSLKTI